MRGAGVGALLNLVNRACGLLEPEYPGFARL